jgi:integrase
MSQTHRYSLIRRRLSSLRRLNKLLKFGDATQTEDVYLAIRRLKRAQCMQQRQAAGINHDILVKMINVLPDTMAGTRNKALLSMGYDFLARRSELCAFKFEDICKGANGKPAIRLNFSKTDQFGAGKILLISQELFDLLEKWRRMISDGGYLLRSINRHGHIGSNLHPASISTILKALQKDLRMESDEQPLSGHSFRVGAALDLLEQGEPLERIMLRGGWQTDSTAMKYLRNWAH